LGFYLLLEQCYKYKNTTKVYISKINKLTLYFTSIVYGILKMR